MKSALLSALEQRRERGLRALEWSAGKLQHLEHFPGTLPEPHGVYLLSRAPEPATLWADLFHALSCARPLVLLPPAAPAEAEILLRQLPFSPPASCALALFTSGSTGEPKAVLHSLATLEASAAQLVHAFFGHGPTASLLPAWGMAGLVFHCLFPALRGSPFLFSREPFLGWAALSLGAFSEAGVELVSLNPFLLEMLLRASEPSSWNGELISLTSPLRPSLAEAFAAKHSQRLIEIYGLSEMAGPVLLDGKSLGARTRLNQSGELELHGPQLFLGYSSGGSFLEQSGWFPTGDLFKEEGTKLSFVARQRELIDLGGRKLAPRVVEEAVENLPEIAECLAFPLELAGVERVGLVFVRGKNCALPAEALSAMVAGACQEKLSAEARPKWWKEVASLPRLKNGKLDRAKARSDWAGGGAAALL